MQLLKGDLASKGLSVHVYLRVGQEGVQVVQTASCRGLSPFPIECGPMPCLLKAKHSCVDEVTYAGLCKVGTPVLSFHPAQGGGGGGGRREEGGGGGRREEGGGRREEGGGRREEGGGRREEGGGRREEGGGRRE